MSITRRDFVKIAGVGAGALALPGFISGCVNKAVNKAVLHGEEALLNADPNHLANYFEQQLVKIKHELDNGANLVELVE